MALEPAGAFQILGQDEQDLQDEARAIWWLHPVNPVQESSSSAFQTTAGEGTRTPKDCSTRS